MSEEGETKCATVLDPFDRVSEVVFDVPMAMSFIGVHLRPSAVSSFPRSAAK
jgi:hypothetical protein